MPAELATKPELLYDTVQALVQFADPQTPDADALEGFRNRLQDLGVTDAHRYLWRDNLTLMRWLLTPPATDSVWRFVLRNAYQPELLARRQFAFVVGNPPWLSYRYIRRTDYQQRVQELVFQYDLLARKQAHLFTQMELATLFFAFCADRYLAEGGTLAFVMPRSVLTGAKQHAAFRDRYVATARYLIDCEQVAPLFNVPACVVLWHKKEPHPPAAPAQPGPIPTLHLKGQLLSRNASLEQAEKQLEQSEQHYRPPSAENKSPYWSRVTNGATIFPRCLWFVRPPATARVIDQQRPQLETDPATEPKAKPPWQGIRLQGSVEAEFLFATLLSDDLLPFGWRRLSLVVLPWKNGQLITAEEAIRQGKTGLADWLRKADTHWRKHRKSQEDLLDYLNWQRKLTAQSPTGVYKLLYNTSGTHLCACVVDAINVRSWQVYNLTARGLFSPDTTYWFETADGDEAHYLCSILNAGFVDQFIKPFQPKGAFGAQKGRGQRHTHRLPFEVLPIPRYDRHDGRHAKLAHISQCCHAKVAKAVADADERWLKAPIGRLRTELRNKLLKDDLAKIDALVIELLKQ